MQTRKMETTSPRYHLCWKFIVNVSLSVCLCLSVSVSLPLSLSLPLSVSVSLSVSQSLSSLCPHSLPLVSIAASFSLPNHSEVFWPGLGYVLYQHDAVQASVEHADPPTTTPLMRMSSITRKAVRPTLETSPVETGVARSVLERRTVPGGVAEW